MASLFRFLSRREKASKGEEKRGAERPVAVVSRARLLLHGTLTGLLAGTVTGVLDAVSSRNEFLDAGFLWVAVLAWITCWLPAGGVIGLVAAAVATGDQHRGWRSPVALAAVTTTLAASLSITFLVLVYLNVSWLGLASAGSSLLVDGVVCLLAAGLAAVTGRLLAHRFRHGGLLRSALWRVPGIAFLIAAALVIGYLSWPKQSGQGRARASGLSATGPNVVLVLIDTLRRDHLSYEGYPRATSPFLTTLAARGSRFSRCYSQSSYTKPSVASLLTSRYLSGHQAGNMRSVLSEHLVTLPEVFHAAGYRTAMVVANPVISEQHGFSQGAELFHSLESLQLPQTKLAYALAKLDEAGFSTARHLRRLLLGLERRTFKVRGAEVTSLQAPEVVAAFCRWQDRIGDAPFFAYLHLMEPHAPYVPPPQVAARFHAPEEPFVDNHPSKTGVFLPFSPSPPLTPIQRAGMIRAYDAEIAYIDQVVEQLVNQISARGGGRDTIIAITSDHGEEFYEHRAWGHGHSLHRELLEVPLLLLGPGIPADTHIQQMVELIDLAPTLLEAAGLAVPKTMTGRSLLPLLRGDTAGTSEREERHFAELQFGHTYWARALQLGPHKLIVSRLGERQQIDLYDLDRDPAESNDLSEQRPALVQQLQQRIDQLLAASRSDSLQEEISSLDDTTAERLRALGYLQ